MNTLGVYECVCVCIQREKETKRDCKELVHAFVEAGKAKICNVNWRYRKELMLQSAGRVSLPVGRSKCFPINILN